MKTKHSFTWKKIADKHLRTPPMCPSCKIYRIKYNIERIQCQPRKKFTSRYWFEKQIHSCRKEDQRSDYLGHEAKIPEDLPEGRSCKDSCMQTMSKPGQSFAERLVTSANNWHQNVRSCLYFHPLPIQVIGTLASCCKAGTEDSFKALNFRRRHQHTLAWYKWTTSA